MAIIVEDGTGKADANAYWDVADVDTYWADHGDPSDWSGKSDTEKADAIRLATQALDVRYGGRWLGRRGTDTQALDWPRAFAYDHEGFVIDGATVPTAVKHAMAELAMRQVQGDSLIPDLDNPGSIKRTLSQVGSLKDETEYAGAASQTKAYSIVDGILRRVLIPANTVRRA